MDCVVLWDACSVGAWVKITVCVPAQAESN